MVHLSPNDGAFDCINKESYRLMIKVCKSAFLAVCMHVNNVPSFLFCMHVYHIQHLHACISYTTSACMYIIYNTSSERDLPALFLELPDKGPLPASISNASSLFTKTASSQSFISSISSSISSLLLPNLSLSWCTTFSCEAWKNWWWCKHKIV